jgi:hypothetical protein
MLDSYKVGVVVGGGGRIGHYGSWWWKWNKERRRHGCRFNRNKKEGIETHIDGRRTSTGEGTSSILERNNSDGRG